MNSLYQILKQRLPGSWSVVASDAGVIIISDPTIERGKGYRVELHESFQLYNAEIQFDSFAIELSRYVERQLMDGEHSIRKIFAAREDIKLNKFKVTIDDAFKPVKTTSDGWWLTLEYKKGSVQTKDQHLFADLLLAVLLFLLPYDIEAEEEGAASDTLTRYERSRLNRSLCLAYHGYQCKACGLNLTDQYGDVARRFIHIHHVSPVAVSGVARPDPIKDLVPLCPNCHGIAHLNNPPYTIEEITNMIIRNNGKIFS